MDSVCDVCRFLNDKPLKNQILTTQHWTVGIVSDQPYLGRGLITLFDHKASLGELSDEEWQEFHEIVRKLEPAYEKAFGAKPLNIGCFMNHGYRDDPPHPHVHWQIFPRYKVAPVLDGVTYEDHLYGSFYDDSAERLVGDEVVEQIVAKLKEHL